MAATNDIGYYTLPVILSFEGVEKQVTSKLTKAFGDVGKKSSKAMADATEADVNRAAAAYGKLKNKAEDALGKVRVEEEKLKKAREGGKADQIVAAEERLNKARRDAATANRAAADSLKDLERAQDSAGSKTGNLGLEFGKLSDLAGKAGTAMVAAGVTAAAAATVGIAALAAGVIAAGRELYNLGAQWDEVTDKLSIRTAKIGPDLDKLKTAVKDLAPSTASSINDIGGVVGAVSQALRLTGQDLNAVSKTILDLNRLTGEDLNIRDLGKAFRGFGVDATRQVGTLDALYRASAKTGLSVNDLLGAVVAAGPAARTMGMSLSETAALLATFDEAGIDGEKALGALSLAAKNLAKDNKAPAEGLRATVTEIDNLIKAGREADAINIAAKIFGKGYGPILDAIRSGALDAQSLNEALAAGGVTIDELAKSTADWEERWQQLKNTLSVALEPIATGVFNLINSRLDGLADWITQNQSKVIGFFGRVADFAFNAAQSIVSFVADALRALGTMVEKIAPALSDIGDAIEWIPGLGKAGQGLKDLGKALESWPKSLNGAADAIEKNINGALQKGQDYTEAFIERTKQATRFTEVLGETVATLNEDGEIVLSDNTPEVEKRLKGLGIIITELSDGSIGVKADTDEAKKILENYRDQEQGKPISIPVVPTLTPGAGSPITDPFNPGGILGDVPTPGRPRRFAANRSSTGSEKGLTENSIAAKRAIEATFPQIQSIGGYRPTDVTSYGTFNEHSSGQAIDVMIPNWGTPGGKAYGDRIAQWALANADTLGTEWVLWQQTEFHPDGRVRKMGNRGNPTANHFDHVHIKTKAQTAPGAMRRFGPGGAGAPMSPNLTPGLITGDGADAMNITEPNYGTLSASIDTSGLYSAPMDSGMATPGYKDGKAGYYQPDSEKIRQAQQAVDDANQAIKEADSAAAQARARRSEMTITADESARLAADSAVQSAEYRAQKARREAADAETKLAEARRGDFTAAKDNRAGGGRGASDLGGASSILSSFLKETFGFGDFLPALDNFWPLQAADTLLTFGLNAANAQSQGGTSGAPFGIPDIPAPPMPQNGQHTGSGANPGPGQIVNIDQSQNFTNSPLGWDPAQVNKERDRNINRAPRLPVGMG